MTFPPAGDPRNPPDDRPIGSQPGEGQPFEPLPGQAAPIQAEEPRLVQVRARTTRPIVTYIIIGVTIFAYLLQMATQAGMLTEPFLALARAVFPLSLYNEIVSQGLDRQIIELLFAKINILIEAGQWWRLLTPALLHAGLLHVGFNMYALFSFGPQLENSYGRWRFLALYLLGALGGNTLSFLMTQGNSVGASTAIFGLFAAEFVLIYQNRKIIPQARNLLSNLIGLLVVNLVISLTPGIDLWGHLGGLLAGGAFAWLSGPILDLEADVDGYKLIDRRAKLMPWVAGFVVAAVFLGLAFYRIATAS